jgi:hypothetical protein
MSWRIVALVLAGSFVVLWVTDLGPGLITVVREGPKLRQPITALTVEGVPAEQAIATIMGNASSPLPVALCRSLASRPITLHLGGKTRLDRALQGVAHQLEARLTWYVSMDPGSVGKAYPEFWCPEGTPQEFMTLSPGGQWR